MTTIENITAMRTRAWPFLLRRLTLRTASSCLLLMLLFVATRRWLADFAPLAAGPLVAVGLAAPCLVFLWRLAWRNVEGTGPWQGVVERFAPSAALALLAVGLSISGTPVLALAAFWLLLVGSEVAYGLYGQRSSEGTARRPAPMVSAAPFDHAGETAVEADEEPDSVLPPGVSQQITRAVDANGETLDCLLRVTFAVGEQTQAIHVAFCPPLVNAPTATTEQIDGAPCEIKVTAAEVFGARLEVKRRGTLSLEDEAILLLRVIAQ